MPVYCCCLFYCSQLQTQLQKTCNFSKHKQKNNKKQ